MSFRHSRVAFRGANYSHVFALYPCSCWRFFIRYMGRVQNILCHFALLNAAQGNYLNVTISTRRCIFEYLGTTKSDQGFLHSIIYIALYNAFFQMASKDLIRLHKCAFKSGPYSSSLLSPFILNGLFHHNSLYRSISNRSIWLDFIITIFYRNSYI